MSLIEYGKKRLFQKTPEPKGKRQKPSPGFPEFVIQKHAATALHYDLRLEHDGAMLSWAVPKGVSMDPSEKRFAKQVEDHPLEYRRFEGVIPEGSYGAGTVIVWDSGQYTAGLDNIETKKKIEEGLKKGHLSFVLAGKKVLGGFDLVRLKNSKNDWLLIKKKDEYAGKPYSFDQRSVLTGRTMEEVSFGLAAPMPHNLKPMLAQAALRPFNKKGWIFEIKWDGYRAIAEIEKGRVELYSRNFKSFNKIFSEVAESLSGVNRSAIIDGEIVVVGNDGKADFQALQDYLETKKGKLIYYVFDLLYFDGHDLREKPLLERKNMLKKFIPETSVVKYSDHVEEKGTELFLAATKMGLEGIVGKDTESKYLAGRRSASWLKIKGIRTTEAIIAGYTKPAGGRKYFKSLILGTYDPNGKLEFIGHVGTGFSDKKISELFNMFEPLVQEEADFVVEPKLNAPAVWLSPQLVCTVKYAEWTKDGVLRQPVFLNLRKDIEAKEVKKDE